MQEKTIKALAFIVALPLACTPHSLTFVNVFSWLSGSSLRQSGKSFSFVLRCAHARTLRGRCLEESGRSFSRVREADPAGLKLGLFVPGILLGSRLTGSFWKAREIFSSISMTKIVSGIFMTLVSGHLWLTPRMFLASTSADCLRRESQPSFTWGQVSKKSPLCEGFFVALGYHSEKWVRQRKPPQSPTG